MRGHKELIELRMQGIKPGLVDVFDVGDAPDGMFTAPEAQLEWGHVPEIWIARSDVIERLDWRFLVGLVVRCHCDDLNRARALYSSLKAERVSQITISDGKSFVHHEVFKK